MYYESTVFVYEQSDINSVYKHSRELDKMTKTLMALPPDIPGLLTTIEAEVIDKAVNLSFHKFSYFNLSFPLPSSPLMYAIISLHDHILFILSIILIVVLYLLGSTILLFDMSLGTISDTDKDLDNGSFLKDGIKGVFFKFLYKFPILSFLVIKSLIIITPIFVYYWRILQPKLNQLCAPLFLKINDSVVLFFEYKNAKTKQLCSVLDNLKSVLKNEIQRYPLLLSLVEKIKDFYNKHIKSELSGLTLKQKRLLFSDRLHDSV